MKNLSLLIAIVGFTMTAAAADAPQQVTFTKDVAPIFQEHCQNCHHAGTVAPMSLVKYEEARPWARAIKRGKCRRGSLIEMWECNITQTTSR
jgi:cytochrome c5